MVQSMEQIKDQIKQSGAMTKGPITEDVIVEAEKNGQPRQQFLI